jgi:hypothetical protein
MSDDEIARDDMRRFVTGLDLGQAKDFSALAILERIPQPSINGESSPDHYAIRHLERPPLGTSYPTVVNRVKNMFSRRPLSKTILAVDQTGVGRAVVDQLQAARVDASIRPVTITGGHNATRSEGMGWLVPKKELVGTLQVLLQGRRVHVAKNLPEARTLVDELIQFQVKVTASAHETFGTWGEGRHDDLVLAVAIAAWAGENIGIGRFEIW